MPDTSTPAKSPNAGIPNTRCAMASSHLRIARPSKSLAAAQHFWVDGLGLDILWRSGPASEVEGEHELLMVGWKEAAWHLELVQIQAEDGPEWDPQPTEEDLLVLYLDAPVDPAVVKALVEAGGKQVAAKNPYWERYGVTVEDPDGYRLVLCQRSWKN